MSVTDNLRSTPGSESTTPRIAVMDPDPRRAQALVALLGAHGCRARAVDATPRLTPAADAILLDMSIGKAATTALIPDLRRACPGVVCIVMADAEEADVAMAGLRLGADDYLKRPFTGDELLTVLARALARRRLDNEKAAAEAALRLSEARYRAVFEHAPSALREEDWSGVKQGIDALRAQGIEDLDGHLGEHGVELRELVNSIRVLDANSAAVETFRAETKQALLERIIPHLCTAEIDRFRGTIVALAGGESSVRIEGKHRAFDGGELSLRVIFHLPDESRDSWSRIVVSTEDIGERQRAERALRSATEEAERADRAKSRFLAAASHDLRQPLHAMGLFVSTLGQRLKDQEDLALNRKILASLENLNRLFDALLDISRLEAGVVTPRIASFDVSALLEGIALAFSSRAQEAGLELRIVACSAVVKSDPALLESILNNLVSNAIRYTQRGRVLLGCRRRNGIVRIEVWDTGPGIPEGRIRGLFREFQRLRPGGMGPDDGLGLGLAIVDRLSKLLDHPVRVASQPGRGSVFAVEVPLGSTLASSPPVAGRGPDRMAP